MVGYEIGELAEKYETSGRGPGFISNGDSWDPGGDSYGSYQLASKVGTLQGYLRSGLPYTNILNDYTIKSAKFNTKWKSIASADSAGFKQSQFDYVATISYKPCRAYADALGIADTFAINSALFSISNQSGGWKHIIVGAHIQVGDSETMQINKLYEARANYFKSLHTMSQKVKDAIVEQRTVLERADCLKLVSVKAVPVEQPDEVAVGLLKAVFEYIKGKFK